jgi:hypothetical protein
VKSVAIEANNLRGSYDNAQLDFTLEKACFSINENPMKHEIPDVSRIQISCENGFTSFVVSMIWFDTFERPLKC